MPRGITEQDVFQAADLLLERGERPTIERVRHELGTGSPNTVNRLLDLWWASLAKRMAGKSGSALPASLLELCERLYRGAREEASREASVMEAALRESVEGERKALEERRRAMELVRTEATALVSSLREELARLTSSQVSAASRIATLETQLEAERTAAAEVQSRLTASLSEATHAAASAEQQTERVRSQWEENERRWLLEIDALRSQVKRNILDREKEQRQANARLEAAAKALQSRDGDAAKYQNEAREAVTSLALEREKRIAAEAELVGVRRTTEQVPRSNQRLRGYGARTRKPK